MAQKGYRQKKRNNKKSGNHDVLGITLVVISLFLLLCIAIPPILSVVSRAIFNIILGVFGIVAYPTLIAVFLLGVFILLGRTVPLSKKSVICTVLLIFFGLVILQLASTHAFLRQSYVDYIADVYSAKYSAGGVIFGTIAFGLKSAITEVGCYVVFSVAVVTVVVILTDLVGRIKARKKSTAPVAVVKAPTSGFDRKGEAQRVVSVDTPHGLFIGTIERKAPPIQTETGKASEIPVKEKRTVTDYADKPVMERDEMSERRADDDKPLSEARFTLYGDSDVINRLSAEEFSKQYTKADTQSDDKPNADAADFPVATPEPYERVSTDAQVQPKKIVHACETAPQETRAYKHEIYFPIEKKTELNDEGIENVDDIKARLQRATKERKQSDIENAQTPPSRSSADMRGASFIVPEYGKPAPPPAPIMQTIAPSEPPEQIIVAADSRQDERRAESVDDRFLRAVMEAKSAEPIDVPRAADDDIVDAYALRTMDQHDIQEQEDVNPDDIIDGTSHQTAQAKPVIIRTAEPIVSVDGIIAGKIGDGSLVISDEPAVDLSETHDITSDIIDGDDLSGMYISAEKAQPVKQSAKRQKANAPLENQITIGEELKKKAEESVITIQTKQRKKYNYTAPPIDLLKQYEKTEASEEELQHNAEILENVVSGFLKTQAHVINIVPSSQVTRYELEVPFGVSVKGIEARSADIAYELAAVSGIRVEAPIPGKRAVGIEVPNTKKSIVGLREIIDSSIFAKAKSPMTFSVGKDIGGNIVLCDLEKVPHLLIAGQTGSGKSAGLNGLIISMLYKSSPEDLRFILVDPKRVEFSKYRGMPHLLFEKIITEPNEALNALKWAVVEMDRRYTVLQKYSCNKVAEYNGLPDVVNGNLDKLPHIVIIIDELANLMQSSVAGEIENKISSIAALARAAGIHLIVATQRPSADVITGTIKANLTSRIAFRVGDQSNSRIILDTAGAEALAGNGDMLFFPVEANAATRVQGSYVSGEEVVSVVSYIKEHFECDFDEDAEKFVCGAGESGGGTGGGGNNADPLLPRIVALAINSKQVSTSVIQRRFSIGYARAARIIDNMEDMGYIGPSVSNNKGRDVYITKEQYREKFGADVDDM